MQIQFNTDKTIEGGERHLNYFTPILTDSFRRFDSNITSLQIHVSDENGKKEGINDIQCLIEARLENMKPVAVKAQGKNVEVAVSSAIDKMKASLETIIGKQQNR
jgi:ribosome-associated translation inhibitor RaiA